MILSWPLVTGALILQLVSISFAAVTVSTLAGNGFLAHVDGPGNQASFSRPTSIAVDPTSGDIFVLDTHNQCIRRISPNGVVSTFAKSSFWFSFSTVKGMAIDTLGNIFVSDWANDRIKKITPTRSVKNVAGKRESGHVDGPRGRARFNFPTGVAVDTHGNVLVADANNHCVRKISPNGIVSTVAGNSVRDGGNGTNPQMLIDSPEDIAVDSNGNLYVADRVGNCIYKISTHGVASKLAGDGVAGYRDGPGETASFETLSGITVDMNGNVFVTDYMDHRIRKITPDGIVSTVAGNGDRGYADGPGRTAMFSYPSGIAADADGNLYVSDWGNRRIRKITFTPGINENDENDDDGSHINPEYFGMVQPKPIRYNKDECAICYEAKAEGDEYDYCSTSCGNTFHKACIDRCMALTIHPKCPMCRSNWIIDKSPVTIPDAAFGQLLD